MDDDWGNICVIMMPSFVVVRLYTLCAAVRQSDVGKASHDSHGPNLTNFAARVFQAKHSRTENPRKVIRVAYFKKQQQRVILI